MSDLKAPTISESAFVDSSATILGDVMIGDDVYVAPNASIRADEPGSRMIIRERCNVQDNVAIHALMDSTVKIGVGTTLGHGCIVHGPCTIGDGCFIGFGAVVFKCTIMEGAVIMHRALVTHSLVPPLRMVGSGEIVDSRFKPADLPEVPLDISDFVDSVRQTNIDLARMYSLQRMASMVGVL